MSSFVPVSTWLYSRDERGAARSTRRGDYPGAQL